MIQEIIAYLIIIASFGAFIYNILSFFNMVGKKSTKSGNCAGCTSGCEIKELHVMNKPKFSKHNKYQFYL
jgi:hypothetical protein